MDAHELNEVFLEYGKTALSKFASKSTEWDANQVKHEKDLDFPILGFWMASILVANSTFKITLKAHYCLNHIKDGFLPKTEVHMNSGTNDEYLLTREFGKEFLNWWAGATKEKIDPSGADSWMGLPSMTRGFDELFSRKSNNRDCFYSARLVLGTPTGKIWLSTLLELKDPERFQFWMMPDNQESDASQQQDGEVEFL
jgi:hypothetical protein